MDKIHAYYMFDTAKDAPFQILLENPDDPDDLPVAAGCFFNGSDALLLAWPEMPNWKDVACEYEQCTVHGTPELAIEDGATHSHPSGMHIACVPEAFRDCGWLVSTELVEFKES